MKIQKIDYDKKKGKLSFALRETTPPFANLLRRLILENVPTLAIEEVEFKNNDSILYDEVIAHRLGLLPLTTDLKTYNLPGNCKCKGKLCARCSVTLTLTEKGPKIVYASSLKSKDPKVKPVFPETPIVKLLKDQKLQFIATAVLGQGKEHTKWSPAHVHYKSIPIIEIKKDKQEVLKELKSCKGITLEETKRTIKLINPSNTGVEIPNECMGKIENKLELKKNNDDFIFFIESWGQLPINVIISKAIGDIHERFDEFSEGLKKSK
jgi:DNA-directed RNA polymerase subunit D